ncbi:YheT family hydrolase [Persicitalea jodogahamensis]|uniref:Alpha/beta hydrolase n=1 Tax=Persicitalea jodogahamensis TaxID=402147 RepID=A0A8J3D737_9BACT|nr:alpha/beta fold hydrolase [Persicitalea jodogahamensis]GHB62767.1 alpha/beta hydrolase [Persicitalea jodogahamensis]
MPLLRTHDHQAPFWLPNGHLQTIFPALFRKIKDVRYTREQIVTPDEDFLNLDWSQTGQGSANALVILSHGLEGDSQRQYILGMVRALTRQGFDCLAWNYRSCGGEMNKQLRFYHSGATEDLETVVRHALLKGYQTIHLMGFSLGGNLTLKYLGEKGKSVYSEIKKAVVFSVPMDLLACSRAIEKPENRLYLKRFLGSLKPKVHAKAAVFPEGINAGDYAKVKTFYDFDHIYTAALHGFEGADDYYRRNSAKYFVESIKIPTLIVNALNDPLVPAESLPQAAISRLPNVWLELTGAGGHCGFRDRKTKNGLYWSEKRAIEFLVEESPAVS